MRCIEGKVVEVEHRESSDEVLDIHVLSPTVGDTRLTSCSLRYELHTRALPRALKQCMVHCTLPYGNSFLSALLGKILSRPWSNAIVKITSRVTRARRRAQQMRVSFSVRKEPNRVINICRRRGGNRRAVDKSHVKHYIWRSSVRFA